MKSEYLLNSSAFSKVALLQETRMTAEADQEVNEKGVYEGPSNKGGSALYGASSSSNNEEPSNDGLKIVSRISNK